MKVTRFGKGQGLADKAGETLPQCVAPALNMCRLSAFFTDRLADVCRKHQLVGVPKITTGVTNAIRDGDVGPQLTTGFLSTASDHIGYGLARTPTQSYPEPTFVTFSEDKRPQFIQFQDISQLPGDNVANSKGKFDDHHTSLFTTKYYHHQSIFATTKLSYTSHFCADAGKEDLSLLH